MTEFRTVRILKLLAGMDHATADALATQIACPREEVLKTLRNMRARGVITTGGGTHRITDKGRNELLAGPPQRAPSGFAAPKKPKAVSTDVARPQSEFLLAQPSGMTAHPDNSVMRRPTWTPEPWVPARSGADDHKVFASRGIA